MEETLNLILKEVRSVSENLVAMEARFDKMEKTTNERFAAMEARFDKMEKTTDERFTAMEARFDKMEKTTNERFAAMEARFDKMEKTTNERFAAMEARFDKMEKGIDQKFSDFSKEVAAEIQHIIMAIEKEEFKLKQTIHKHYDENIRCYKSQGIRLSKLENYQSKIKLAIEKLHEAC